jgi:hypothetical protein
MKLSTLTLPLLIASQPLHADIVRPRSQVDFTNGSGDGQWNTAANWDPVGVPVPQNSLSFPNSGISNNNFSAAVFHSLGYSRNHSLTGNAFTLTNGISGSIIGTASGGGNLPGAVVIAPAITLGNPQSFNIGAGVLTCTNVLLNGQQLTTTGAGMVSLKGLVNGTGAASRIVKTGTGILQVASTGIVFNEGGIALNEGTLDVLGFVTGPVSLSDGKLTGTGSVGSLSAFGTGEIEPGSSGFSVTGNVELASQLVCRFNFTGPGLENELNVGGAVNLRGAELAVNVAGYNPQRGDSYQIINKTATGPITGTFGGLPEGAVIPLNTSVGRISYLGGNGNDVVITVIATTRTWDGGAIVNDNWTDADNWTGNIAPTSGDILLFPAGIQGTDRGLDNDFPEDTTFRKIVFKGDDYTLRGNRFRLSDGMEFDITADAPQINLDTDVVLADDQFFLFRQQATLHLDLLDEIDTDGHDLRIFGRGEIDGKISGSGAVTITALAGVKNFSLSDSNTYTGQTSVSTGAKLSIKKEDGLGSSAGKTVIAGDFEFETKSNKVIAEPFVLEAGGIINSRGAGGGSPSTTEFRGLLDLSGSGLKSLASQGQNDDVTEGIHEWHGNIVGNGSLFRIIGDWTLTGTGGNTADGKLEVNGGALTLNKTVAGVLALSFSDITVSNAQSAIIWRRDHQITPNAEISVLRGKLDLGGHSQTIKELRLVRNGSVIGAAGSVLGVTAKIDATTSVDGIRESIDVTLQIEGTPTVLNHTAEESDADFLISKNVVRPGSVGSLQRTGTGRVTFGGSLELPVELKNGVTHFNGTSGASATMLLNGGTIGGTGTVGNITSGAGGGKLAPGVTTGTLACRTVAMNAATRYQVEIGIAAGLNGHDRLTATGGVALGGATLEITELSNASVPAQAQLLILQNDLTDSIIGTFANLPEGSFIPLNSGGGLIISYRGGDGNDVLLTKVAVAPVEPKLNAITFSRGTGPGGKDQISLSGSGTVGSTLTLETSIDLVAWSDLQTITPTPPDGTIAVTINQAPGQPKRFFRLRIPQ